MNITDKRFDESPLDEYEIELKEFLDKGEFVSSDNLDQIKKLSRQAADNYLTQQGSKKITLRVNKADVVKIKAKAKQSGLPYQRIIQILIHQYAEGKMKIKI